MILVDTSVWADHFRSGEAALGLLLGEGRIMIHPFVIGELALGDLRPRHDTLAALRELPQAPLVSQEEFLSLVDAEQLVAAGVGFVDAHLLLAARRNPGIRLWTRDKRLAARAAAMDLAWSEPAA